MSSHARQPLHLSASMVMALTVFLTLPIAEYPPLLEVFGNVTQVQCVQGLLRRNALAVEPLELVVGIQKLRLQLGETLLPVVRGRLFVAAPQGPAHVDGGQQGAVARGGLPEAVLVHVDTGRRRNEGRIIVYVVRGVARDPGQA